MKLFNSSLVFVLFSILISNSSFAQSKHSVSIGKSNIYFTQGSGQLSGEMTPPGILAKAQDTDTITLSYDYYLNSQWSLHFALGLPPKVELFSAGDGPELGKVGDARSISPGLVALYHVELNEVFSIYAGGGFNYSTFTDATVTESYTQAFHGTQSKVKLKDDMGSILKFGAKLNLSEKWFIDLSYAKYQSQVNSTITTSTPVIGDVIRTIKTDVDPEITTVMLGYRF